MESSILPSRQELLTEVDLHSALMSFAAANITHCSRQAHNYQQSYSNSGTSLVHCIYSIYRQPAASR